MISDQSEFDIRTEWGLHGIQTLAPLSDVIIIVDILSFSTCVDIAVNNNAVIYPHQYKDETAVEYAKSVGALLADVNRTSSQYSLSPSSLKNIPADTKLVLPSPNGSALSLSTGNALTLCGSIRNSKAVAEYAMNSGKKISVIPAGEKWKDGSTRFAVEDLTGAGMIISYLQGNLSPESKSALAVYSGLKNNLKEEIKKCCSGKELIEKGFEEDVDLACEVNVSNCVPELAEKGYQNHEYKLR